MTKLTDLQTPSLPSWCPGCGDFNIWAAFKNACVQKDWNNSNSVLVAGIGCHGHIVNFVKITSFEGLHGRALPVATGIKLSNHKLNVFVFTGDGDCFGEGGNHFIHAARRNHDLNVFIHNNSLYALTTGQTSPLTSYGAKSKSTPKGNPDEPINPLALAIISGATFVARAYSGDMKTLSNLMIEASEHKGFSVIDILQPCVTFNKTCTHNYYQENTYTLDTSYNPSDKVQALSKALNVGETKIPLGVIYKTNKPSYESHLPQLDTKTLVEQEVIRDNIEDLLKVYC